MGLIGTGPILAVQISLLLLSGRSCALSAVLGKDTSFTIPVSRLFGDGYTGKLIPIGPNGANRGPDGAVGLRWTSAPPSGLKGADGLTEVWLNFDKSTPWGRSFTDRTTVNITGIIEGHAFASKAKEQLAAGVQLPMNLANQIDVSALQTRAACRSYKGVDPEKDLVEVFIPKDTVRSFEFLDGQRTPTLLIDTDPIEIRGRQVALAQFVGPAPDSVPGTKAYKVNVYDMKARRFSEMERVIHLQKSATYDQDVIKRASFEQMERNTALNEIGWYLFGEHIDGNFIVQSMEPRDLTKVKNPPPVVVGKDEDRETKYAFLHEKNFQNEKERKGQVSAAQIQSTDDESNVWREGDRGLLVHIYGAMGTTEEYKKYADPLVQLPFAGEQFQFSTGHFSYGYVDVRRCPFTQELRFDITYNQVYTHNREGVVAGRQKFCVYSGSFERGLMYAYSISDAIVKNRALAGKVVRLEEVTNKPLTFLDLVNREIDVMAARYRSGDGLGTSWVGATNNCAQDSNLAMWAAYQINKKWIERKIPDLEKLGEHMSDQVVPDAMKRDDWVAVLNKKLITRSQDGDIAPNTVNSKTLSTWRVMAPRWAYDGILRGLITFDFSITFLRASQVGGWQAITIPIAPGWQSDAWNKSDIETMREIKDFFRLP